MATARLPTTTETRLRAPGLRPESIPRQRLHRQLEAATRCPLTVLRAPAGYGKTTALVQWLEGCAVDHAWLSLDPHDNDPRWLGARLLAALERALPGRLTDAARFLQGGSDLVATVIPLAAGALAGKRLAIILDDYHVIADPGCHEVTRSLIDTLPQEAAVVIATRESPPLRLGRRRAAGTLAEIGPEALRFAAGEAERLLNGSLGLQLGPAEIELIEEQVQGWAAGLVLVGSALATRSDRTGLLDAVTRSRDSLDAYLTEEVLEAARPELRDFLYRTSILTRLSGPLCEAVVGDPGARDLLEEVRRLNLFVTPIDPGGSWLRYHQVFADTLRRQLERRDPELRQELHRRASDWFEQAGETDDAVEHALLARDGSRAASLLAANWMALIGERRHATLRRFLDRLPAQRGEFGPMCDALDVLCMVYEGVDQRLAAERADALAAAHGDDPGVRLVLDGIQISPFYGEVTRAVQLGREAWERYAGMPEVQDEIGLLLALVQWFAGDYDAVRRLLEPRLLLDQHAVGRVWTRAILSLTESDDGDPELAERYAREATAEVEAVGGQTATEFTGVPWVLGEALRRRGKLEEAREHIDRGLRNEARRPGSIGHALALTYDAELALTEGDRRRATRSARSAREMAAQYRDVGTLESRLARVEAALSAPAANPLLGSEPTPAELRVLRLLDSELTLAEIASELYVTRETVKSHTRRLYRRLGAGSRSSAVAIARERGLLEAQRAAEP